MNFRSIFALIFYRFSDALGRQLGAILALRRPQDASKTAPKTKCARFFAPAVIFWSTSPPLGVIRARIGKIWGSVSEVSGAHAFTFFELFEMYFSNEVDSKLLGVGGMGEAILDFLFFFVGLKLLPQPLEFTFLLFLLLKNMKCF